MTTLWGGDPQTVKEFVADQFAHIDEFSPAALALGFLEPIGDDLGLMGGVVLEPRGGGFDAELSILALPGVRLTRGNLRALFSIAFEDVGLARLTCHVARANKRSREFVERLGFRLEGTLRHGFDGRQSACVYGMTRDECRWLERRV